jgi:aryl carrier-like protein
MSPQPDISGTSEAQARALTPTEEVVTDIWQGILNVERVARGDHFFKIGGDSIAALRVLKQVEAEFGVALPVQDLFESPTLEAFAGCIDAARGRGGVCSNDGGLIERLRVYVEPWHGRRLRKDGMIVTLNEKGTRPGIFWCLQGFRELKQLASHLGCEHPVHGLRSGYLLTDYADPADMDLLATHYAAEIEEVQDKGPLLLGGNCQGGVIMQFVAERLRARGRTVSLLVLMEPRLTQTYGGSIALIFGRQSDHNPYVVPGAEPDANFRNTYPAGYVVEFIDGEHGKFFEAPNIQSLAGVLTRILPA